MPIKNRYQSIMRNGRAIDIMYIYIMDSPGVSHVRKPALFFECILLSCLLSDLSRFQEPSTEPCADASPAECHDPAQLATMCSDCEYAQYCRKSCGLCQSKYRGKNKVERYLILTTL